MSLRERIEEIHDLCAHICQDFLRLVLKDNWQELLYDIAEDEQNGKFAFIYEPVHKAMRDNGIENYSVSEMDLTLINNLLQCNRKLRIIANEIKNLSGIRNAFESLHDDRNDKSHFNRNERPHILLKHGLIALDNIDDFISAVDDSINTEQTHEFRMKYMKKKNALIELLCEDSVEEILWDMDIHRVVEGGNTKDMWNYVQQKYKGFYSNEYGLAEKAGIDKLELREREYSFTLRASDAGVIYAHIHAAWIFWAKQDFQEAERRIMLFYHPGTDLSEISMISEYYTVKQIVDIINALLPYYELTNNLEAIVDDLRNKGYKITENRTQTNRVELTMM